jgi:hypothetical protein
MFKYVLDIFAFEFTSIITIISIKEKFSDIIKRSLKLNCKLISTSID